MREIKFRGKRVDNGEWVVGDIVHHDGVISYIGQHFYDGAMIMRDLQPETIGQFTGLHDKNGKEIYEGDILFDTVTGNFATVEVLNGNFYVNWGDWPDWSWEEMACDHLDRLEIIGNNYENPELLRGEKQ